MRLTISERWAVVRVLAGRYRKAGKVEKGRLLDELVKVTGYNRSYTVALLRGHGATIAVGPRRRLQGDLRRRSQRSRPRIYDEAVMSPLRQLWMILDCICGKRLVAIIPDVLPVLERHRELVLNATVRAKLLRISAASIDRLLAPERQRLTLRGRSGTKPGTLLKSQIPIRTFAEWNDAVPGFVEIDLVGHDGGHAEGDFCQTLDVTDVASGWTEPIAVPNKAQVWVFAALKTVRTRLPFPLQGVDSDNGSEFINTQLLRYCVQECITFTRGRAGHKNDGCFVEQKNYSVVRRAVGYARYDTAPQLRLLNELYDQLRLYNNFFQPVMKLVSKERHGAKVKKTYDRPQTPYQRLLRAPTISAAVRKRLRTQYAELNPAALKRHITQLQAQLHQSATRPTTAQTTRKSVSTNKSSGSSR